MEFTRPGRRGDRGGHSEIPALGANASPAPTFGALAATDFAGRVHIQLIFPSAIDCLLVADRVLFSGGENRKKEPHLP